MLKPDLVDNSAAEPRLNVLQPKVEFTTYGVCVTNQSNTVHVTMHSVYQMVYQTLRFPFIRFGILISITRMRV